VFFSCYYPIFQEAEPSELPDEMDDVKMDNIVKVDDNEMEINYQEAGPSGLPDEIDVNDNKMGDNAMEVQFNEIKKFNAIYFKFICFIYWNFF